MSLNYAVILENVGIRRVFIALNAVKVNQLSSTHIMANLLTNSIHFFHFMHS